MVDMNEVASEYAVARKDHLEAEVITALAGKYGMPAKEMRVKLIEQGAVKKRGRRANPVPVTEVIVNIKDGTVLGVKASVPTVKITFADVAANADVAKLFEALPAVVS